MRRGIRRQNRDVATLVDRGFTAHEIDASFDQFVEQVEAGARV